MRALTAHLHRLKNITASLRLNASAASSALAVVILASTALTAPGPRRPTVAQTPTPTNPANGGDVSKRPDSPARGAGQPLQTFDALIGKANAEGSVRVIVGLRSGFTPEGAIRDSLKRGQRVEINRKQNSILSQLTPFAPKGVKQFKSIPYLAMTVNTRALEAMRASADVESIREDGINRLTLAESRSMIGSDKAGELSYSGLGQVVAVLDTGVEKTHPFLSGKVVSEACFSTNDTYSEEDASSLCPGKAEESTAPDSAVPCTLGVEEGCQHGTHVAGIAAGGTGPDNLQGVAKDAGVVAIQVFSRLDRPGACGTDLEGNDLAPCVRVYDSDYMLGLEHVLGLKQSGMNIASANLSFGSYHAYSEKCDGVYGALPNNSSWPVYLVCDDEGHSNIW